MSPDLLTLIRRACEGTAAEGLGPRVSPNPTPTCLRECKHFNRRLCLASTNTAVVGDVCRPAVEALARLAVDGDAEVDRLTEDLTLSERGRLLAEEGRDLLHRERIGEVWLWTGNPTEDEVESLSCPVLMPAGEVRRLVREVERLTEALRVATVSPPLPSNGCEPAAVEGVELVWQRSPAGSYWTLCEQGEGWIEAPYAAHETGVADSRPSGTHCHCDSWPAACRWIADRARADGYRVPPHPLGWDVGGGE